MWGFSPRPCSHRRFCRPSDTDRAECIGLYNAGDPADRIADPFKYLKNVKERNTMKKGEKLVIVGCSGSGGPAAMLSKKLMPEIDVTVIRKEPFFIVR